MRPFLGAVVALIGALMALQSRTSSPPPEREHSAVGPQEAGSGTYSGRRGSFSAPPGGRPGSSEVMLRPKALPSLEARHQRSLPAQATSEFPRPSGPVDAKVKVLVVTQKGSPCHRSLLDLWQAIGEVTQDRVRVAYVDEDEASQKLGRTVELGCRSGVLINGKNRFEIETEEGHRVIYLTGPGPGGHRGHGWVLSDVAQIFDRLLEQQYGEGGELTAEAISRAMEAAKNQLPAPHEGD